MQADYSVSLRSFHLAASYQREKIEENRTLKPCFLANILIMVICAKRTADGKSKQPEDFAWTLLALSAKSVRFYTCKVRIINLNSTEKDNWAETG